MAKKKRTPAPEEGIEKKPEKKREESLKGESTGSTRIRPDLAYKLRIICEARGVSAAVYLEPLIRDVIQKDFKIVSQQLAGLAQKQESEGPEE